MAGKRSAAPRDDQSPVVRGRARAVPPPRAASLDLLIHGRTRLAIISSLAVNPKLTFNELKAVTEATDGNLSVHAHKLEEAGYVTCTKGFDGRLPKTEYRLTDAGRRALRQYLDHMEAIIKHARSKRR
jgi:DNA-binding PadR family transcriptional regulator